MTRPVPPWNGDPLYIVGIAKGQLGLRDTDPQVAVLQRQVMAAIEDVQTYLAFDYRAAENAPISDVVTESVALVLVECYRRRDAAFGVVGTYSEDGTAIRVSADWLAGHAPQLHPLKRGYGLA